MGAFRCAEVQSWNLGGNGTVSHSNVTQGDFDPFPGPKGMPLVFWNNPKQRSKIWSPCAVKCPQKSPPEQFAKGQGVASPLMISRFSGNLPADSSMRPLPLLCSLSRVFSFPGDHGRGAFQC